MGMHCCCLHVKYTVYQHFGRSLHIESLDATKVQNFRPASLTVFEILGFKLKKRKKRYFKSMKNHFYKMKRDIGMADYEKLVKQDFHTPSIEFHTPSLYLCFFL